MSNGRLVHTFSNGLMVYDAHLLQLQRERYANRNVHEEEEEDVFVQLISSCEGESTFVNVGAAIGYYCILAAKLKPSIPIVAVEPLGRHRGYLEENCRLNGLLNSRFRVVPNAICAVAGPIELADRDYSSSVLHSGHTAQDCAVEQVQGTTLSNLCKEVGGAIGLLQMDIQGEELNVLKEYASVYPIGGPIGQFLIGTHSLDLHIGCRAVLVEMGYTVICDISNPRHQPDGVIAAVKRQGI